MAEFKPIDKTTISSAIVSQIAGQIESGVLKPGNRIPPERTLCEMFCVGRGSVREAIKILETMGLIKRSGKAVIVSDGAPSSVAFAFFVAKSINEINYIIEARNIIETESCRLAALRSTKEDISRLTEIANREITDFSAFSVCDREFHKAVMEAAHNPILLQIYVSIEDLLFQTETIYTKAEEIDPANQALIIETNQGYHKSIINAILAKDSRLAAACAKEHLITAGESLIRQLQVKHKYDAQSSQTVL